MHHRVIFPCGVICQRMVISNIYFVVPSWGLRKTHWVLHATFFVCKTQVVVVLKITHSTTMCVIYFIGTYTLYPMNLSSVLGLDSLLKYQNYSKLIVCSLFLFQNIPDSYDYYASNIRFSHLSSFSMLPSGAICLQRPFMCKKDSGQSM